MTRMDWKTNVKPPKYEEGERVGIWLIVKYLGRKDCKGKDQRTAHHYTCECTNCGTRYDKPQHKIYTRNVSCSACCGRKGADTKEANKEDMSQYLSDDEAQELLRRVWR